MWAIVVLLAYGLATAIERSWVYFGRWKLHEQAIMAKLRAGELEQAATTAGAHPVAGLIRAGAAAQGGDAAWDAMGAEAALVEREVRRRLSHLAAVGNLSTMMGLLGTVYGLMFAFMNLSTASAVERSSRLSEGIGVAMATTLLGLLVAIPALGIHTLLEGKANSILSFCQAAAARTAEQRRKAGG
jgi:biopolymer transport protein ExbB/TolQ